MDKLLNLLAAIQEENPYYHVEIIAADLDGYDFILNCKQEFTDNEVPTFRHDEVIKLLNDFGGYGYSSYVDGAKAESYKTHNIEILVKV